MYSFYYNKLIFLVQIHCKIKLTAFPFYFADKFSTPTNSFQKSYSKENSKMIQDTGYRSFKNQGSTIILCLFNYLVSFITLFLDITLNTSLHNNNADIVSEDLVLSPNELLSNFFFFNSYSYSYN